MRIVLSRIQYVGVTREEVDADRLQAQKEDRPVQFPRSILIENAIGFNEAFNCVVANVGYDIREVDGIKQADCSTIAAYEVNQRTGAYIDVQLPETDAVFNMA